MPRGQARQHKAVESLTHEEARRRNLPSAEHQPLMREEEQTPVRVAYERRNHDLDPQLVWRGKDEQDEADLVVNAPPLYIQERVHPKALIDDLMRQSRNGHKPDEYQTDMFADFNGLPSEDAKTEFYQHDANWSNRMILGDSLQVMASLAEREGLRGKVQCIYIDPPYGIRFNSNFQWSTTSRDVRDGNREHITREPEQVKAFRDTWRDGVHSYLTYLRDRLTVARDLLAESGSIFMQIGDENVHRVRALLDEVFGETNFVAIINVGKSSGQTSRYLSVNTDYLVWYSKNLDSLKFRQIFKVKDKDDIQKGNYQFRELNMGVYQRFHIDEFDGLSQDERRSVFRQQALTSQRLGRASGPGSAMYFPVRWQGKDYFPGGERGWSTTQEGLNRVRLADRMIGSGRTLGFKQYLADFVASGISNDWSDMRGAPYRIFVVQTNEKVIERCIQMTTDPGDLVLDPTCGSGTTAYVAEQWGRRWITIDTSRVALALARARIMGARYSYYLLADSQEGQRKQAEIERRVPSESPTYGDVRQGFVYERVPHITLRAIANNAEIDVIWEVAQQDLGPMREELNRQLDKSWEEWEIPHDAEVTWPDEAKELHAAWWERRIARQKEIDASIAANADYEYLYDKPYEDRAKVRVAGPFTVESISPHRVLGVDENGDVIDGVAEHRSGYGNGYDFGQVILENLKTSGVQQAHREDRIEFTSVTPWPGRLVGAEGIYVEGGEEDGIGRRAAIFIGPEFGTVSRPDLVEAAREAADADFDVLIACAFNYEAHTTEFESLGRVPVLKARMNADLHMADDLKNTGKGNLFVIFGEPDIDILDAGDGQIMVKVNGVDVFHPNTGEVRSDGPDGIACWFIDTDYNEEAFFVRHAYFLGASDPYRSLKTTLKAEIDADAWSTLHSDTSRPFPKPESRRIAVKVINHLGDEVLKVFRVV
ncbi:MAG: DNA methyltransferase [Chloroflexota bacterium]|nr:DNA methyltransferase [Chloroflexota bacterium]MDE2942565.1 DNA methyltransferase [Chloroflexota bacterium]